MDIQIKKSITFSDLHAAPNIVLLAEEVEFHRSVPIMGSMMAGVRLDNADGPNLPRFLYIQYHGGSKNWNLVTEYSIQKATQFEPDTLPNVVAKFEERLGITLPEIKIIDFGIGVYTAQTRYISENPWALQDDHVYRVLNARGIGRTFRANVKNGKVMITFVDDNLEAKTEAFEPGVVLSLAEWKTMRPFEKTEPAPLVRPRPRMQ